MQSVHPRVDTLICISTSQEIANVLPAIGCSARRVISLATSKALKDGWPARLENALALHDQTIQVQREALDESSETSPSHLKARVLALIAASEVTLGVIGFAWGGGQKPQATGLWMAFQSLVEKAPDAGHIAIYSEANSGKMLWWQQADMDPVPAPYTNLRTEVHLAAFGIKTVSNDKSSVAQIWKNHNGADPALIQLPFPDWLPKCYELFMQEQSYRKLCFEYAAKWEPTETASNQPEVGTLAPALLKTLLETLWAKHLPINFWQETLETIHRNSLAKKKPSANEGLSWMKKELIPRLQAQARKQFILKATSPALSFPVLPDNARVLDFLVEANPGLDRNDRQSDQSLKLAPGEIKFSYLFEKLVSYRAWLWMRGHPEHLNEAFTNLVCQQADGNNILAEFDLLMLSRSGRLVNVDVKSFKVESDKLKSQIARLTEVGGFSTVFRFCFPMFTADCGTPDRRDPEFLNKAQPWFPRELLFQIANSNADKAMGYRDALSIIRFDETDAFEKELSRLLS